MHDRPLGRGQFPAIFGFGLWEFDDFADSDVESQLRSFYIYTGPHDPPRLGDSLDRSAAKPEIHWRLSFARCAAISTDEMCWRCCARDEEDPDICVEHSAARISAVVPSPAKVVQCVFWFPAKPLPEFICHQSVESRTFVDFIEVRQRFSLKKFLARLCVKDRRPISIVQQSLSKIGGGGEIFQQSLRRADEVEVREGVRVARIVRQVGQLEGFLAVRGDEREIGEIEVMHRFRIKAQPDTAFAAELLQRIEEALSDDAFAVVADDDGVRAFQPMLDGSE